MLRSLMALSSPGGRRARLSTLIFHRVTPRPDELFPDEMDAARFDTLCGWLRDWFHVLPLGEAVERLYRGDLPARSLALTFDDGYADNRTVAAPILQRHGLPCTFYIATGFLDGGCMWNDVIIESVRRCRLAELDLRGIVPGEERAPLGDAADRRRLVDRIIGHIKYLQPAQRLEQVGALSERAEVVRPDDLMMRSSQVREMHDMGFSIGAHTVNHPILARLARLEALSEIDQSRRTLEQLVQAPVTLFAYPNGKRDTDYGDEAVSVVRELGFENAVSTNWGVSTTATDRFQLARFTPWDRGRLKFGLRLARNAMGGAPAVS